MSTPSSFVWIAFREADVKAERPREILRVFASSESAHLFIRKELADGRGRSFRTERWELVP